MPIIDHSVQPTIQLGDRRATRSLVDSSNGAISLTITEMIINPGYIGHLHTHNTEQAITVLEGSIQLIAEDQIQTVRSGHTLFAPAGTPHKLVNNTWIPARLHVVYPSITLKTNYLE
ncbi:cupin domain-containing protein [SAR202 cluster bacterium AD-804-J14_MRT_500m]|nr:cupin domain-containing protein [SAR202 cluster bacterium AD-804-J14_MRT_500m]